MKPRSEMKVAIAYPHPPDVKAKFMRSMLFAWRLDALAQTRPDGTKVGGHMRILDGGALLAVESGAVITRGRTQIVTEFLKLDADWLLQIDTDMVFDATLVEDLIAAAHPTLRPIVGGLCFSVMKEHSRQFWPTLYAKVPGSNRLRRLTKYPVNQMVQVGGTGAACLLVHRSVFEAMAKKYVNTPWPWFCETPFSYENETGKHWDCYSEDLTFCLRAQACGFPVYVHTGIKLKHTKEFDVDERMFLQESAVLAEFCKPALPTFAVIASRSRPEMLATLRSQLEDQVTETFVFDNGYDAPPPGVIPAHGEPLHSMWNRGLEMAEKAAGGQPFNVLVINDDCAVPLEACAQLESGLRVSDDHWIAYPNFRNMDIPAGEVARTVSDSMAGQTISGHAFMLKGEAGLRFDERYQWWYGDTAMERTVRAAGKYVVAVGGCFVEHMEPLKSTMEDPVRLAQAEADEALFAKEWGIDPDTLWLAQRKVSAK